MLASLRFRLWLTYLLVIGVLIAIFGVAVIVSLLRSPGSDRRELQRLRLAAQVALQRRRFFEDRGQGLAPPDRLEQVAGRLDAVLDARMIVFDQDGTLLADTRQQIAGSTPSLEQLNRLRMLRSSVFEDDAGRKWLYVITPLDGGQTLITAGMRLRPPLLATLRDDFLQPFGRALILALALSVIMTLLFAGWVTAPLQRLTAAVHSVSQGEFRRIPPAGPREIQELARSFNEMTERVETSQRAQRDLVANVSHDLKTPLTSIQGFSQALLDDAMSGPEETRRAAQIIYDEAARMNRMLAGLLDLTRFDAGQPDLARTPFDLAALLAAGVEKFTSLATQAQVSLKLEAAVMPAGLMMVGDPDRLGQVFDNLLDNALKYTPAGGQVRVIVRPGEGWVDVRVEDTGPGIPPDELERVFERFYQTDKSRRSGRPGAGLGLAIARQIVQAHGGTIRAENLPAASMPSSGAAFIVHLPSAPPDSGALARRPGVSSPAEKTT